MNHQYPLNLDTNNSAFIMLSAYEWSSKGKSSQSTVINKSVVDTITLPLPNNGITNSISNNWAEEDILKSENLLEGLKASIARKAREALKGLGGRYTLHSRGETINDFASLMYDGVNMRDFNFSWSLIPNSEEEANEIEDIIIAMKKNCLPEHRGWKILYPNFWKIRLVLPGDLDPITFNDCVLTTLTNTYFEDNKTVFNTGHPTKITLLASFKELDKLDRNNF